MTVNRYLALVEYKNPDGEFHSEVYNNKTYSKIKDLVKSLSTTISLGTSADETVISESLYNDGIYDAPGWALFQIHTISVDVDVV